MIIVKSLLQKLLLNSIGDSSNKGTMEEPLYVTFTDICMVKMKNDKILSKSFFEDL